MTSNTCWQFFFETGDPIYYLLYQEALSEERSEEKTA